MEVYTYQKYLPGKIDGRKITDRFFDEPFPVHKIVSPLYITQEGYNSIPKPEKYKSVCIVRDPRNVLVSWYFSIRDTHAVMGKIAQHRNYLKKVDVSEGLLYSMKYLNEFGLFDALKSWTDIQTDVNLRVYRFEDITGVEQRKFLGGLLKHCEIYLNVQEYDELLKKYSFVSMRKSHLRNDGKSHYRSNDSDGWMEYFDSSLQNAFKKSTADLVERMGYEW